MDPVILFLLYGIAGVVYAIRVHLATGGKRVCPACVTLCIVGWPVLIGLEYRAKRIGSALWLR